METTLIAAFAAAFALSAVDYWRHLGALRVLLALLAAVGALVALGTRDWTLAGAGPAAAFLGLSAVSLLEWVLTRPTRVR